MTTLQGKVALVTGANSGLGKATALGLARLGATVVMVCRSQERGAAARDQIIAASGNQAVDLLLADLSSQQAVRRLAAEFTAKYTRLDLLINNAGGFFATRTTSADGIEYSLAINYLAQFLLSNLLLDPLKASAPARIINVATQLDKGMTIDLDDMQFEKRTYSALKAYSQSKLAVVMFTSELARRLAGSRVTVNAVHPGVFKSNMGTEGIPALFRLIARLAQPFIATPEKAAERIMELATAPELAGVSGKYLAGQKELPMPAQILDGVTSGRLWQLSEQLTA
jgi:NAD(P)-dependent dehydrogenase (short-subunit alcohol dehydrogenase family)